MGETGQEAFTALAWQQAWLAPLRGLGAPWARALASGADMHQVLNSRPGSPCRFVPQSALPAGQAYEQYIFDTGKVPTRTNLHDFFNALIWQHYPLTKRRLNQLQAGALAQQGVGAVRGPLRDACTLFDENGAVLQAPEPLWQALLARDWQALFVTHRALWARARLTVFGHAALEQLVRPRKGITVHVLALPCPVPVMPSLAAFDAHQNIAMMDEWLCAAMRCDLMRSKPFTPLPVLGIPGWCAQNAEVSFYDDPAVFRPRRMPVQA